MNSHSTSSNQYNCVKSDKLGTRLPCKTQSTRVPLWFRIDSERCIWKSWCKYRWQDFHPPHPSSSPSTPWFWYNRQPLYFSKLKAPTNPCDNPERSMHSNRIWAVSHCWFVHKSRDCRSRQHRHEKYTAIAMANKNCLPPLRKMCRFGKNWSPATKKHR